MESTAKLERGRLAPVDCWTIVYILVSIVILFMRFPPKAVYIPAAVLVCVALVAALAPRARRGGAAGAFLGEFYPVLLTIALYNEVGWTNLVRGVSRDATVQKWEQALFGGQPSLHWMSAWPHPAVSSIFHLAYLSYYLIVLGTPLVLWFSGRREAARETILIMMVTFYISYTGFRLFPVAGPRFLFPLPDIPAVHTPVAAFVQKLVAGGSAWGTAFPSSHVAVAFANAANAWRFRRRFGAVVWLMAVLLALATVYGQFHYAIDALAGAALAAVVLAVRISALRT